MGKWVRFDTSYKSYVRPEFAYCEACGKMIPKDAWVSDKEGKGISFCDENCEILYDFMSARRKKH
jgi:hypothetical protein